MSAAGSRWSGLRVLVTGGTSGIGEHLVRRLVGEGASVLVHGRAPERTEPLVRELQATGRLSALAANLASLAGVDALAASLRQQGGVDAVVHNAGVGFGADRSLRETSSDGVELRFAVNYLAPFVLNRALLAAPTPPRAIIHVASIGQDALDFDDLLSARSYDGVQAYRRSKLALIMHTVDVAESYPDVACDALHPGTFLDTPMVRQAGIRPLAPASRGADAIAYVLGRAIEARTSGTYFDETSPARAHEQAYDQAARRQLRERTAALLDALQRGGSLANSAAGR